MSNVATSPVNYNPPRAGGLCARVWDLCAAAKAAGAPLTSKNLAAVAAQHGLNLNNVKIEFSRYNRYSAVHPYPATAQKPAGNPWVNMHAPEQQPEQNVRATVLQNMLAALPAPVLPAQTPVTPQVEQLEQPAQQKRKGKH